ncbi:MAG: GAF domain-containing protein, partial [Acidimicrobiales bacterium]
MSGSMTNPLFDLLDECILVARGDTVVEANATAARLLGGDPRGRRLLDLVPRPVAGAWMRATESTATLEVAGVESTDTATIVVLRDVSAAIVSRDEAARCSEAARLVADFSRRMSEPAPDGLDDLVDALLAELAAFLAVDRAAVVRHGDDGTFSVTHEWVRPGVASRRETEQNVPLDRAPWTTGVVLGRDWVHVADLAAPEELSFAGGAGFVERDLLLSHGLRSVVQIPLVVAGSVVGRLVLESRTAGIEWDESETIVVTSFVSGLVATLGRVEAELGLQACAARASAVERAAGDVIVRLSAALREPLEQMVSAVARLDDLSELSTWTSEHPEALGRGGRACVG